MTAEEAQTQASLLRRHMRGRAVTPADPEYEGVRFTWNGMIERRRAALAKARAARAAKRAGSGST